MEARGVEPLSRDVSARTSTCVSGRFESRPRVPGRQGASWTSPEQVWPRPYQAVNRSEPDLATDWEALPAGAIARGYLVKQPEKTELRQLKLGRLLTWPADQPRHAIRASYHPVETGTPPSGGVVGPATDAACRRSQPPRSGQPADQDTAPAFYETSADVSVMPKPELEFPEKTVPAG